ncbi:D-lyxose/D-mannose family sugar isomerase [uncultured Roseobacter sp.]|uniref:D-lyxose/D-mannose family sugar isomerase n=1 Tax=uncultured Roseobacter sp. TaxID=114847 RepID=UPI002610AE39|nr:D-lyxose/D-mannose family sugar isomerase [uncultured Roseobacter sp.]
MKRSRINDIMAEADEMIRSYGFVLPPFARWTPDEFQARRDDARQVIEARCGWDITDYGAGRYDEMGLFLFTLRNGRLADLQRGGGMCYAEKLLISKRDQLSPMHTHVIKAEDIINRGGATLVIELFGSDDDGKFAEDRGGTVWCDGIERAYAPGEKLRFAPGESVTLMPGDWHAFWGEGGDVLIGEVSTVNDDETDNIFRDPIGRFAEVEEDVAPTHLLVSDYRSWLGGGSPG